jgi:hypothetical protein
MAFLFCIFNLNEFCAQITFSAVFVQHYTSYKQLHFEILFSSGINKFMNQTDWAVRNGQI